MRNKVQRATIGIIRLDLNNPQDARLWAFYQGLTESGQASQWMRKTLIASLPATPNSSAEMPAVAQSAIETPTATTKTDRAPTTPNLPQNRPNPQGYQHYARSVPKSGK